MKNPISAARALTGRILSPLRPGATPDTRAKRLLRRFDSKVRDLQAEERRLRRLIEICADRGDAGGVQDQAGRLAGVLRERRLLEGLAPSRQAGTEVLVFSTMMLAQSFRVCTETEDEGMHFIAGVEYDGVAVGTHLIPFPYAHRSVAGASGDPRATHRIVIQTHEAQHRLLALLHSHPGSGPRANLPSSIDDRTQRLWERGSRLVGGIWSRDGFLRWYSVAVPFRVELVGSHMEKIDERLFKLVSDQA